MAVIRRRRHLLQSAAACVQHRPRHRPLTGHEIRVIDDLQEINEPLKEAAGVPDPNEPLPEGVTHRDIKAKFEADPTWDNLPGSESSAHFRDTHRAARSTRSSRTTRARKSRLPATAASSSRTSRTCSGLRSDFPFYCFNASITSIRAPAGPPRALAAERPRPSRGDPHDLTERRAAPDRPTIRHFQHQTQSMRRDGASQNGASS